MKNNLSKRTIVLDFDDTIVKSSEEIIRQINKKYNLSKTIDDLKDWGYKSIHKNTTSQEVLEMYGSDEFFDNVAFNYWACEFINKYEKIYDILICSKGDEENLLKKEKYCSLSFGDSVKFIGMKYNEKDTSGKLDKSEIDFSNTLFCVDDNTEALLSTNSPMKILMKNNRDVYWNKTPMNQDNIYVINDFFELDRICEFDEKLREGMILIES